MKRFPVFAGQFYPDNKKELLLLLDKFFSESNNKVERGIIGGIAPHAGYVYSGKVASYTYSGINTDNVKRIVLIGSSHNFTFNFGAIDENEIWISPFGEISVDKEFVDFLLKESIFKRDSTFHKPEHSLEVQIPFIQYIFKDKEIKIVPILIGTHKKNVLKELSDSLKKYIDKETLIVVSSDFYHGYSYEECVKHNRRAKNLLESMEPERFFSSFIKEEVMACGGAGIYVLLDIFSDKKGKVFYMTTSGDVIGVKEGYVVGYVSFGVYD
jgi:hypothetical protein